MKSLKELIEIAQNKEKKKLVIAVAEDKEVLVSAVEAIKLQLVEIILVGHKSKILQISENNNLDLSKMEIIDEKDSIKASAKSVELVKNGHVDYIMKGMINTSDLLRAFLNKEMGLVGKNLLSHIMLFQIPNYHKLLIITDGGMVSYPTLSEKISIINNAVQVAHLLNMKNPKVAPLCAVETVNPSMQATVDAAILTQMNKRGQIKGCIIDGPLAFDNAISVEAAMHKGIISEVAGDSDILLAPNIEAGNFIGKSLTYFAKAENAGIIVGGKCPIVLVSRSDSAMSKLYSIALGAIMCN